MTTDEQRAAFLNLKPSALIRSALKDLQDCDKDPEYEIDMAFWHKRAKPNETGTCLVCMAGAVMSKSLGLDLDHEDRALSDLVGDLGFIGEDVDRARRRFDALDEVRFGNLSSALGYLRVESGDAYDRADGMDVTPWDDDEVAFAEDVEAFAVMLEEEGF